MLATVIVAAALMYSVKATGTLRVSERGELEGLDLHEHDMVAYPEYVIHGFNSTPRHRAWCRCSGGVTGQNHGACANVSPRMYAVDQNDYPASETRGSIQYKQIQPGRAGAACRRA